MCILPKNVYILAKYTHTHKKLTYFDHPNTNIDHYDLRIIRISIQ